MKPLKERIREILNKLDDEESEFYSDYYDEKGSYKENGISAMDKAVEAILTEINNTRLTEEEWEKVVTDLMPKIIWGYICKECGGGGAGEERSNCPKCNGVGITDWQTKGLAHAIYEAGTKKLE